MIAGLCRNGCGRFRRRFDYDISLGIFLLRLCDRLCRWGWARSGRGRFALRWLAHRLDRLLRNGGSPGWSANPVRGAIASDERNVSCSSSRTHIDWSIPFAVHHFAGIAGKECEFVRPGPRCVPGEDAKSGGISFRILLPRPGGSVTVLGITVPNRSFAILCALVFTPGIGAIREQQKRRAKQKPSRVNHKGAILRIRQWSANRNPASLTDERQFVPIGCAQDRAQCRF